jgi:hypothetical protein
LAYQILYSAVQKTQQNTGATRFDSTIQVARAGGRRSGQVVWLLVRYVWSSHATQQGAALPLQGQWRGKTRHVIAPQAGPRHVSPVLRHHEWRGTGIWTIGATKSVSFKKNPTVLDLKLY